MPPIPAATAIRGAGARGVHCSSAKRSAIMASATQSVGTEVSGIPFTIESRLPKNGPLEKWIPRSFGSGPRRSRSRSRP